MTAINVLLQRERAYLITDAAWYDAEGVLRNIAPKSAAVGHWPGAIATRGPGLANSVLATEAGLQFPDFDTFANGAAEFLKAWTERNAEHLAEWAEQGHVEVVAIGWSKSRDRTRGIFFSSRDDAAEAAARGIEADDDTRLEHAFEVFEIESGYLRPQPTLEAMAAAGLDPDMDLETQPVLTGTGARIVVAQRELREPIMTGGDPVCFVGGFVVNTVVDRTGVHVSKGIAFPDEVGRRIEATRGDAFWPHSADHVPPPAGPPEPPPSLSRQQRRAWEAQQRRKGAGRVRAVS